MDTNSLDSFNFSDLSRLDGDIMTDPSDKSKTKVSGGYQPVRSAPTQPPTKRRLMTDQITDAVARAICPAWWPEDGSTPTCENYEGQTARQREAWRKTATAAIAAFLEAIEDDEETIKRVAERLATTLTFDWSAKAYRNGIVAHHQGDCTNEPFTCQRCYAEEIESVARAALAALAAAPSFEERNEDE